MVDFSKYARRKPMATITDPIALFESLDRKASHIELRNAQKVALTGLSSRRSEIDVVLKMPTGMGKSTVALLYLLSYMRESGGPGVYLCPTVQLVEQVLDEASKLGIKAHHYAAGQPHPDPECLNGKSVIVCTYDKLFNSRTTFDRADVRITPVALVMDDAHAGIEEVRDAFTLNISEANLYQKLISILGGACSSYASGMWESITTGRPDSAMEVPYWAWSELDTEVQRAIVSHADENEIRWQWPYLRDLLKWCRCIVSSECIEISPYVTPVHKVRAYTEAAHRLFMSATLADDSLLIRELGCSVEASLSPIMAGGSGLGERMVLVPSLLDKSLNREWVMKLCARLSRKLNVVVLCRSERSAREWEDHGAQVFLGSDVSEAVRKLRSGNKQFVAFAQRYDGIDLPDDACRMLVIDGMPYGQGAMDEYDASITGSPGGMRHRLVHRLEQGMGRAVRSHVDYSVVILAGPELASFTAQPDVRRQMTAEFSVQLEVAHELAEMMKEDAEDRPSVAILDMIRKCLSRDAGWKAYYNEKVRDAVASAAPPASESVIRLAAAERQAATQAQSGDSIAASETLQEAINSYVSIEKKARAPYLQELARYMHSTDPSEAVKLQKLAHSGDAKLFRPPVGVSLRPPAPGDTEAPQRVLDLRKECGGGNALLAAFEALKPQLSFGMTPKRLEQALNGLAAFVGAEGMRPEAEYGEGPDNIFLWPNLGLVIEAKNQAMVDLIPKSHAAQLLHSMAWFRKYYGALEAVPILVGVATETDKGVILPENTRIITPDSLAKLVGAVGAFLAAVAQLPDSPSSTDEVRRLLSAHGLSANQMPEQFSIAPRTQKSERQARSRKVGAPKTKRRKS